MATAEEAAQYIALRAEDYDGYGGENGFGFARATTDEVARALDVDTEAAYRLLKSAARKGLVKQDKERRKELHGAGRFSTKNVGWAIWEVYLTEAQTRARDPEHEGLPRLTPNVSSTAPLISSQAFRNHHKVAEKRAARDYEVLVYPIVVDGTLYLVVLDGHHRLDAALLDGVAPELYEPTGEERAELDELLDREGPEGWLINQAVDTDYYFIESGFPVWDSPNLQLPSDS